MAVNNKLFRFKSVGSENFHCRGFRVKSFASRLYPSPICLISLPVQPGEVLASHKKPFPNTAFIKRSEGKSFLPFPHSVESFTSYLCYCLCCSFLRPPFGHKSKWNYSFLSLPAVFCRNMMSTSNKFTKQQPSIRFTYTENPSWPRGA